MNRFGFVCLALSAGLAAAVPVADPAAAADGYSSGPKCQQHVEKKCNKKPIEKERQECHEEYDVVIDTTYIEKCQDVITKHCQETHTKVHKSD